MSATSALLLPLARAALAATGAACVSVLLSSGSENDGDAALVHIDRDGVVRTPAQPSFADIGTARTTCAEISSRLHADGKPYRLRCTQLGEIVGARFQWTDELATNSATLLVPTGAPATDAAAPRAERRWRRPPSSPPIQAAVWFALGFDAPRTADATASLAWFDGGLAAAIELSVRALRGRGSDRDPISGLPGAASYVRRLQHALAADTDELAPLAILLVNPDDFAVINHRFGRELGDRAMLEIADLLVASVRRSDAVFRYAGAVFAVVLEGADLDRARTVAEKLRSEASRAAYLGGAARLAFSIGAIVVTASDVRAGVDVELITRRADAALNLAKLGGGARLLIGGVADDALELGRLDPLSGIFTADAEKDYRNMLLLWDTVGVVSVTAEPEAIGAEFVARLAQSFDPETLALVAVDGSLACRAARVRDRVTGSGHVVAEALQLDHQQASVVNAACASQQLERVRLSASTSASDAASSNDAFAYALPLTARDDVIGCLLLQTRTDRPALDSSDLVFLGALGTQLAIALDRATLAARLLRERDAERRALQGELRELRAALSQARLVYRSATMHGVVEQLRRIAPSDATVLVIGESGTGKELLARTVHDASARNAAPFVTVDCGAIAANLIEAELFGYVKGAFTGADRAAEGRIAAAHRGTLFLDEIGELPLDLQTKLLRFVQEKEYTPVGANAPRSVDVRIVAATNRRLEAEVAAGRFRADLYYRLNVIGIEAPPLRARIDDILPIAHYFLEKFASQHGMGSRHLTAAAEQRLLAHPWPGNVRELQHCMLRAVLLGERDFIDADGIQFVAEAVDDAQRSTRLLADATRHAPRSTVLDGGVSDAASVLSASSAAAATSSTPDVSEDALWTRLGGELDAQIRAALHADSRRPAPLGRWLIDDLVLATSRTCGDVNRRAARCLGVPESTYRRHIDRVRAECAQGRAVRQTQWPAAAKLLDALADALPENACSDVLERAQQTLLMRVLATNQDIARMAALMGVTPPTIRRWLPQVPS